MRPELPFVFGLAFGAMLALDVVGLAAIIQLNLKDMIIAELQRLLAECLGKQQSSNQ